MTGVPKPEPRLEKLNLDGLRLFFSTYTTDCGEAVRKRRKELHLSQEQLATVIGVPIQTISKVERGDIVPRDYLKAAIALRLATEVETLWPYPDRRALARAAA